jgi:cytoskeletal protein CcmA (bactofilin family)
MRSIGIAARSALLLSTLFLGVSFTLAQGTPAPPEPPTPSEIGDEDAKPREPAHKEISFKGIQVRAGETHHGDISAIAPSGSVEGTLDGDLWLSASSLRISGTVNGDVFFAGSELDITGTIKKSLRAVCGNLVIDGTVEGNVFAPGGSVVLGSRGHVKGNVTSLSGQLVHNGVIDGTLKFSGGNVVLGGKVGEDAELEADTIQVDKGARVEGDISYSARNRMDDELKAIAGGDVDYDERIHEERPSRARGPKVPGGDQFFPPKTKVFFRMLFFSASFLFGCALVALFRAYEDRVVGAIRTDALRCVGVGFVSILVTTAVCMSFILIITLLFIPIYLLLYAVAWYVAKVPVALWVGRTIFERFKKQTSPYLALLVGLAVLYPFFWIPYLGWFIWGAVNLLGLGTMITVYLAYRAERKAALGAPPAEGPPAQAPAAS